MFASFDIDNSVNFGQWKLLEMLHARNQDIYRLYDLKKDPGETMNIWAQKPLEGRVLRQMIRRQDLLDVKARTAAPVEMKTQQLDQAVRKDLEANGYL